MISTTFQANSLQFDLKEKHILSHQDSGYPGWILQKFPESSLVGNALKEQQRHLLLSDLKSCSSMQDLRWGRLIHAKALEMLTQLDMYVLNALMNMYHKSGNMVVARGLFDSIQKPNVVHWNTILFGYVENGEAYSALDMFSCMKERGCIPDSVTYIAALKACTSLGENEAGSRKRSYLERGKLIHSEIGSKMNHYLTNTLIDMYSKCGSMAEAQKVFVSIQKPDVVSWNALLSGYVENGEALDMISKMKELGCLPDSVTYIAALKSCISLAMSRKGTEKDDCLERGRKIHLEIGGKSNHYLKNTLIDMYSKCGSMMEAREVFDSISKPDLVSWNALLLGYVENGQANLALDLLSKLKAAGFQPNSVTYIAGLKACTSLGLAGNPNQKRELLKRGREIHQEIDCMEDDKIKSTLIDMYSNCGSISEARKVFESISEPNVVQWNALLMGYAESGEAHTTLYLFSKMKRVGYSPDSITYIAVLKACTALAVDADGSKKGEHLLLGRRLHSEIGSCLDFYLQNSLIDMYSKCGSMAEARGVFESIGKPNVVSWNALLLGYAENGEGHVTLDLFAKMKTSGFSPNFVTYIAALKACGLVGALCLGRKFHLEIKEFNNQTITCLVDFYAKCGSMVEAQNVFEMHPNARNVTTWTALLAGYSRFGDTDSVFNLFKAMQDESIRPDAVTFVCLLLCCSHAGLFEKARNYFEAMPLQFGVTPTLMHYTCMVDVLGRGNQLNEAISVIKNMPCSPNAVIWTTLLGACRKWKNIDIGREAFQALADIEKENTSSYVLMAGIYDSHGLAKEHVKP